VTVAPRRTVDVITAVHTPAAPYLADAYKSLQAQELPDAWDFGTGTGSSRRTARATPYTPTPPTSPRPRRPARHLRPGPARRTRPRSHDGPRPASGPYVEVLDAEDQLTPNTLARDLALLERTRTTRNGTCAQPWSRRASAHSRRSPGATRVRVPSTSPLVGGGLGLAAGTSYFGLLAPKRLAARSIRRICNVLVHLGGNIFADSVREGSVAAFSGLDSRSVPLTMVVRGKPGRFFARRCRSSARICGGRRL
jgi:hypothetical protein